jgi:hypothetical protein
MASAKKLESDYKAEMVKAINDAGGYATRVEDQYRVGLLDLIFSMPSTGIVLAEAKRFTGLCFEPRARQFIEMCRVDKGGGLALLIGVKNEVHYLHGTNLLDPQRGRVYTKDCIVQRDGETFPELFQRWYKLGSYQNGK